MQQINNDDRETIAQNFRRFRRTTLRDFIFNILHTFGDFDFSLPQLATLMLLDEEGGLTIKQIAELLGRSMSVASRLIDQLVERGLVSRREDERGRRAKRVAITESGRILIATLEQRRAEAQVAVIEHLLPEEQVIVARAMALLAEAGKRSRTHERILATSMASSVTVAITEAYSALGNGEPIAVAVRSSATAEDLPFASFAGQQETYLNVIDIDAVLDAVRHCWASLWTDRAVSYRASNAIDPRTVHLAVAVQCMVEAKVAGILFTANPLTGKRRQAVIDASPGLGEAVVSGAVNPDHFVVNTTTGQIVERRLGDKRILVQATVGGGTQRVEKPIASNEPCLSDEQIRAL